MADEMLQTSTQSGKLVQSKIQTGWALIGSLVVLGNSDFFKYSFFQNVRKHFQLAFPAHCIFPSFINDR